MSSRSAPRPRVERMHPVGKSASPAQAPTNESLRFIWEEREGVHVAPPGQPTRWRKPGFPRARRRVACTPAWRQVPAPIYQQGSPLPAGSCVACRSGLPENQRQRARTPAELALARRRSRRHASPQMHAAPPSGVHPRDSLSRPGPPTDNAIHRRQPTRRQPHPPALSMRAPRSRARLSVLGAGRWPSAARHGGHTSRTPGVCHRPSPAPAAAGQHPPETHPPPGGRWRN